jgi:hypothetical protein
MSCKFCDVTEYTGDLLPFVKDIDGGKQHFEVYIFSSPEDEGYVLEIDGTHTELRIEINYCSICGRKL